MTEKRTRRLSPTILKADREAVVAIQAIEEYRPFNEEYGREALALLESELARVREVEIHAQYALTAARIAAVAAEWRLHSAVVEARRQITAQFGANSERVRAVGLKRSVERKRAVRRTAQPS